MVRITPECSLCGEKILAPKGSARDIQEAWWCDLCKVAKTLQDKQESENKRIEWIKKRDILLNKNANTTLS